MKQNLEGGVIEVVLAWLNSDSETAAKEYVRLHLMLTKMFESRGSSSPEDLADETFERVGRQLLEGKRIRTETPASYLYGVARYIMREQWAKPPYAPLEEVTPSDVPQNDPREVDESEKKETRHLCLDRCLNELPEEARTLILEYYSEDESLKIDTRDRMAVHLKIASGVLRNRIYKLRKIVRNCVFKCLTGEPQLSKEQTG